MRSFTTAVVFDVVFEGGVQGGRRPLLLDFNVFGPPTDVLIYDWPTLLEYDTSSMQVSFYSNWRANLIFGLRQDVRLDVVSAVTGIRTSRTAFDGLPLDVLQIGNGDAPDALAQLLHGVS